MTRRGSIALVVATLWSVGLLVAAVTVPAYSGSTAGTTSEGEPTGSTGSSGSSASSTLVEVNGSGILVTLAIPLAASLVVAAVLLVRGRVPAERAAWLGAVAWLAVAVCGALAVLGLLTIGIVVLPVAVALAVAVATSRRPVTALAAAP